MSAADRMHGTRYVAFKLISDEERAKRDEAEWLARMAKEGARVGPPGPPGPPPAPLPSAFYRRSSIEHVPVRADVVEFPPIRKRDAPPRDPPPAVPLRPAASTLRRIIFGDAEPPRHCGEYIPEARTVFDEQLERLSKVASTRSAPAPLPSPFYRIPFRRNA